MKSPPYEPKPIDTSAAVLDPEFHGLTETLAKHMHDVWARQRLADGWTWGPERNDSERFHPCLVAYEDLPETEKIYDRNSALETLKAITSLGYKIVPPKAVSDFRARDGSLEC